MVDATALEAVPLRVRIPPTASFEPAHKVTQSPMADKKSKDSGPKKRGPKPDTLAIDAEWEDAVSQALKKAPPPPAKPSKKKGK